MDSIKLQKYFSDCGVMSRRAAEEEIKKGRVRVNGNVATLGDRIDPERDVVEYDGKRLERKSSQRHYVLLNKPRGYVTTLSDEKGRPTVAQLVKDLPARVYPVGRLDMDSDGLLLLTDDGELANRLTHPRHEIPKIYHVTVTSAVTQAKLEALGKPMIIDGYEILPVKVRPLSCSDSEALLEFTLYEGRNRQIRKMCELQDLKISRLSRVAIGDITLGSLECGEWRFLDADEISYLKNSKEN
ncbi:MAG: rRNA pseudouridine synthase [Ruminococcaceae bacterium]|nr:rRNA pseudouridine synthase [Oscillospiraceae bacterium]